MAGANLYIKCGFALLLGLVAWTIVASLIFLWGTGLVHAFPHPFWQWWLYFLNVQGNARVALWLKIGAAVGVAPILVFAIGLIVRGREVKGPRLRKSLFGGPIQAPEAITDTYGRARWMTMRRALETFPGPDPHYGGVVVGEAVAQPLCRTGRRCLADRAAALGRGRGNVCRTRRPPSLPLRRAR